MKKISILLLFVFIGLATFAQDSDFQAPNYSEIEKNIQNESSNLHYPKLMARYFAGDSTLTSIEQRHLYYGYVFQPNYQPADTSQYNAKMADLLSKQSFVADDYKTILQYADALLLEDPFNLRALNAKLLVFAQNNDVESYKKVSQQRKNVQLAIVNSGDGMSKSTPYYVIKVAHEYDLLGFLGFQFGGVDKIEKKCQCNYLTLATNKFGIDKMYFDITPVLNYVRKHGSGKI